uniref:Uncharacterized protein n=1 Tax=Oryza glumipatula TaxID=40148 RepID=A0A0D9YQL4_9ORYZ
MMSIAGRNMAQIRSADMACDQKGGLHGKELTPEGDFLVAFLRFGLLYFLLEDEQCDTLIWVDPEWHPRVQKAFEQLWHLLEEEGMKLELEMADRLPDMEISFEKKLSKQKTDDIRNWFIRTIDVVVFLLMKLFDNMYYACRC